MKKNVADVDTGRKYSAPNGGMGIAGGGGGGPYGYGVTAPAFLQWPGSASASASPCPSPRGVESPRGSAAAAAAQAQAQVLVPTTFVQADTLSFKEVVQRLTGASDDDMEKLPVTMPARYVPKQQQQQLAAQPPALVPEAARAAASLGGSGEVGPRKSPFKLHERRQHNLRNLQIGLEMGITLPPPPPSRGAVAVAGAAACFNGHGRVSPRGNGGCSPLTSAAAAPPELSPSVLNMMMNTALVLSPVTPLGSDPFDCPSSSSATSTSGMSEEERAIAEKGFYLHPSPLSTPRGSDPPELLPLFPLHSPRDSESSSS